jgi:hypothetical protein
MHITHARARFTFYALLSRDLVTRRVACLTSRLILLCI